MTDKSEETIIFSCKPNMLMRLPFAAAGLAVLLLCVLPGIWQLGAAIFGASVICGFAVISSSAITVTNVRIRYGKISVPFEEITGIFFSQGPVGKLLGCGNVVIYTSGKRLIFRGFPHADELRDIISKQVDLYHFRQTCRQAETARKMMSENGI